ncbi:hypothetical protein QKW52_28390 [Bacillus sonorensis]|nr:hypothetical protein [Bacillus sonorensis]
MAKAELKWLNAAPNASGGVTWGVPWEIGALQKDDPISITVPDQPAPFLQSWPLAYWPDGSVKWTGHAAVFKEGSGGRVLLQKRGQETPERILQLSERESSITVNTGAMVCKLEKTGPSLISSISLSGERLLKTGRLIAFKEKRAAQHQRRSIKLNDLKA